MTIFELAIEHAKDCGMSEKDAVAMLEHFGATDGKDIGWADIAPRLSAAQVSAVDRAAVAWLYAHRLADDGSKPQMGPAGPALSTICRRKSVGRRSA